MANKKALALPDALIVRYFRADEIDRIIKVSTLPDGRVQVQLGKSVAPARTDHWRDLGGGLGYVPDVE